MGYRDNKSFEERLSLYESLMKDYPSNVPVIVERNRYENDLPQINKKKYLVPGSMTIQNFMMVIKSKLQLHPSKTLWFYIRNNALVANYDTMSSMYNKYKDPDNFLYISYRGEITQG